MPSKKGAPKGNQNARKHGFYSKALDKAESLQLEEAQGVDGLDEEIAVLRIKLRDLIENHPENIELALEAANTIARLVRTRYNITRDQKKSLKDAITNVLTEIAIPIGVKALIK